MGGLGSARGVGRRRLLRSGLALGGLGLLAGCGILPTQAGQSGSTPRIGLFSPTASTSEAQNFDGFRKGLRDLGYVDGQNVTIDYWFADGDPRRLPALAADIAKADLDVVVVDSAAAAAAMANATRSVPIVVAVGAEAEVGEGGRIASLAHPGANMTGFILSPPGIHGKRLELFKEAIPSLSRVALLWDSTIPTTYISETQAAAPTLGVTMQVLTIRSSDDFGSAFAAAESAHADGLYVAGGPLAEKARSQLTSLLDKARLPTIGIGRSFVDEGGLMSYAADVPGEFGRAAGYAVKILEGAKPADLPVQEPTTYDFIIDLKTASSLGLTIPQSVLAQATEVMQ